MNTTLRTGLRHPLALLALTLAALPVHAQNTAQGPGYWHHGWDGGWEGGWGHMMFGGLMMLLFWGGIVVLIVLAVRWLGRGPERESDSRRRPLEILEERFARGEIDKEEFEERRRALSK